VHEGDLARRLTYAHAGYGALLLAAPRLLAHAAPGGNRDRKTVAFARLLGARHLAEAAILGRRRSARWLLLGAAVDAAHAVTMAGVAVTTSSRRPLASANAVVALAFAAAGARAARSSE
jgi:hypothetical protein